MSTVVMLSKGQLKELKLAIKQNMTKQMKDREHLLASGLAQVEKKFQHENEPFIKMIENLKQQKQYLELQLDEVNTNLLEVSETLSKTKQTTEIEKKKLEKQLDALQQELTITKTELETRTKKHDMQLTALNQNLFTVRSDLKTANEKLIKYEQLKAEKNVVQEKNGK
ncbi:unnamed protein product [Didymodactylos carnosus]|uniref:Uncharacterized protein n=1 Tax=Didymodactylos carnosus TaxID=1234261 RepID=A0A8S2D197_9BILA|nr:unnamed protein product [Didymodactylos carnosus]CAF3560961.1 unnamed protein product [Didymodactylos carnosus]